MKILFIHQNFPGQFRHLAPALAASGNEVVALRPGDRDPVPWEGVRIVHYRIVRGSTKNIHPWLVDMETKTIRAEALFRKALELKLNGYSPDIVIAHPGWGESLFIKDIWPNTKLALYCEFFYHAKGADYNFDSEFSSNNIADDCRIRLKNANNLLHFEIADAGLSPTIWQASTFPERFRQKITVIHDGINTDNAKPNPDCSISINNTVHLSKSNEVITFVNRNLEPYRGYHIFMRTLPEIMRRRPKARILIVGGNEVSYGSSPPEGQTWRQIFLNEVKNQLDLSRVHFVGQVPYYEFLSIMQISTVHVYLTYPFVLSWSLLEAMSCGCAITASDTMPVRDVIYPNQTGLLVNFFDCQALADQVIELLDNKELCQKLGMNARTFIQERFDLHSICLPQQIEWVNSLL